MNINVTFCEHSNTRIHTFATKEAEIKKNTLVVFFGFRKKRFGWQKKPLDKKHMHRSLKVKLFYTNEIQCRWFYDIITILIFFLSGLFQRLPLQNQYIPMKFKLEFKYYVRVKKMVCIHEKTNYFIGNQKHENALVLHIVAGWILECPMKVFEKLQVHRICL